MVYVITVGASEVGVLVKIVEELNGHNEAQLQLPKTTEMKALVATDQPTIFKWDTTELYRGMLQAVNKALGDLICNVYDTVVEKMKNKLFTGLYSDAPADEILEDICDVAGVALGSCPSTHVSVGFSKATCFDAAVYIASAVTKDWWPDNEEVSFNIGDKGTDRGSRTPLYVPENLEDRAAKKNHVWTRGTDADGNEIFGEAKSVGWTPETDRPIVIDDNNGKTTATLDAVAAQKLKEFESAQRGVSLEFPVDEILFTGDTIDLNEEDLVGTYRIWKTIRTLATFTVEVDVPVATLTKTITDVSALAQRGIYLVPAGEFTIPGGTSFPGSPSAGDVYFRTDLGALYRWSGSAWELAVQSGFGTSFPTTPVSGQLFYRTDTGIFYQYNGATWVAIQTTVGSGAGTSFPVSPADGDLFFRTDLNKMFRYRLAVTTWEYIAQSGAGSSFPGVPVTGELFYKTDENTLYRYTGAAWVAVHSLSTAGTSPPGGARIGDFFYNTTEAVLYRYDGADWKVCLKITQSGTALPAAGRFTGDLFYSSDYQQTFYWTGSAWITLATVARSGPGFPTNKVTGDIFYRTDENKFYMWNGAAWTFLATPSHSNLEDLDEDDHPIYHTDERHSEVDHSGYGILLAGLDANKPTAGKGGRIYWATDTGKYYRDTGIAWEFIASNNLVNMLGTISAGQIGPGSVIGAGVLQSGTLANRPAFGVLGRIYWATDENKFYLDTGTSWSFITTNTLSQMAGQVLAGQIGTGAVLGAGVLLVGDDTAKPSPGIIGRVYYAADREKLYMDTGTTWNLIGTLQLGNMLGQITGTQISPTAVLGAGVLSSGLLGNRPSPSILGRMYYATDTTQVFLDTGTAWIQVSTTNLSGMSGTIIETQIANDSISAPMMKANSITAYAIAAGAITANAIASEAIVAGKIAAGAVTVVTLAAGAVTANAIAAEAIIAGKVAAGAIQSDAIQAGAITANKIAAGAIIAGLIAANAVTADTIAAGAVTASKIFAGAVTTVSLNIDRVYSDPSPVPGQIWWRSDLNQLRFRGDLETEFIPKFPVASAAPEQQVVASTYSASGSWKALPSNSWTELLSYDVPNADGDLFVFNATVWVSISGYHGLFLAIRIYDQTTGRYFPNQYGALTGSAGYYLSAVSVCITIPQNAKNHTLKLQVVQNYLSTFNAYGALTGWGHSPHIHNVPGGLPSLNVTTSPAIGIGDVYATLGGSYQSANCVITIRGFEWRKVGAPGWLEWTESGTFSDGNYTHTVSGLDISSSYEFRAKVYSASVGWTYGENVGFTTYASIPSIFAADSIRWENTVMKTTSSSIATALKITKQTAPATGTIRVKFTAQVSWMQMDELAYFQVFKNNNPIGTFHSLWSSEGSIVFSEDFPAFSAGDTIEIWVWKDQEGFEYAMVESLQFCYDPAVDLGFINQDP